MKKILTIAALAFSVCLGLRAQEVHTQDPAAHHPRVFPMPIRE